MLGTGACTEADHDLFASFAVFGHLETCAGSRRPDLSEAEAVSCASTCLEAWLTAGGAGEPVSCISNVCDPPMTKCAGIDMSQY
ncbi:MAG: hypothetical protein ACI9WU_001852 [Myxococcota bacterium]|jgi:hypothetical protein